MEWLLGIIAVTLIFGAGAGLWFAVGIGIFLFGAAILSGLFIAAIVLLYFTTANAVAIFWGVVILIGLISWFWPALKKRSFARMSAPFDSTWGAVRLGAIIAAVLLTTLIVGGSAGLLG